MAANGRRARYPRTPAQIRDSARRAIAEEPLGRRAAIGFWYADALLRSHDYRLTSVQVKALMEGIGDAILDRP